MTGNGLKIEFHDVETFQRKTKLYVKTANRLTLDLISSSLLTQKCFSLDFLGILITFKGNHFWEPTP